MLERIREVICRFVELDPETLTEETNIRSELGLNSLELINIAVSIEDEFDVEIPDREVSNLETLGDAIRIIQKYIDE